MALVAGDKAPTFKIVTDGGETDPLAGISSFKRHFTRTEAQIGSELVLMLRPIRTFAFQVLQRLACWVKR